MKKVLAMLMAALMVAAMFTGCSSSKPATETTAAAAATAGTVKNGKIGRRLNSSHSGESRMPSSA